MQAIKPTHRALPASPVAQPSAAALAPLRRGAVDSFARGSLRPADAALAPPSFEVNGKKVVFGDILRVDNTVVFDVAAKKSTVKSVVEIAISEKGRPVIDLVPRATKVTVNGKDLDVAAFNEVRDPANESTYRIVDAELEAGKHKIEIEYELTAGVRFSGESVEFFGRKSDLSNRSMDEQYFPSNLEYDQYPGSITFDIRGTQVKHRVMTNGDVSEAGGKLVVTFPEHYNTASLFLNLINPARATITEDVYKSVDGRMIPVTVYSPTGVVFGKAPDPLGNAVGLKPRAPTVPKGDDEQLSAIAANQRGMDVAKAALAKHEKDIGPYPHPRLVVRISGSGGMEYSGATESDIGSLNHELHHMWFARGAQPANGNAGWIDEAVASWHDNNYRRMTSEPGFPRKLSGFPAWHRITPQAAYSHGASVIAYLDHVFASTGGMRPVLKKFHQAYDKKVFTTEMFLEFLKQEGKDLGFDFDALFKKQVYGTGLHLLKPKKR